MSESAELQRTAVGATAKPLDPGYFDLQLKFAEVVAATSSVELAHAVALGQGLGPQREESRVSRIIDQQLIEFGQCLRRASAVDISQ